MNNMKQLFWECINLEKIDDGDIYLSAGFASVNNYKVGDTITININDRDISLKIKAIINNFYFIRWNNS